MTRRACRPAPRPSRGIALPAMVFVLVIVGLILAAGLRLLAQAQTGQTLALQSARALLAAKSGGEWGLWQVSDPDGALALPGDTPPPCFASRTLTLPAPLADLPVSVSCTREPATGATDDGGLKLASYRIVAQVSVGTAGSADHVLRRFEAAHVVCRNPGGLPPAYAC